MNGPLCGHGGDIGMVPPPQTTPLTVAAERERMRVMDGVGGIDPYMFGLHTEML